MILRNARLLGETGLWNISCRDGLIENIEPEPGFDPPPGATVIDAKGSLVSRSFTDVHMHLDKAYNSEIRANQSGTLREAIEIGQDLKERADAATGYRKMLRGARQALIHGTTRIRTHVDVDPIAGLTGVEAALRAREDLSGLVDLQIVAFPQEGITGQEGVLELLDESLKMGCDVIGGIPANDPDPRRHIADVFALAAEHDVPIDMHVDESDDPADLTLVDCIEITEQYRYGGRVAAAHCCSLSAQEPGRREEIASAVRKAGIHIITLPSTNLYLQGRGDEVNPRRGLTPVKELLAAGVNVTYGSDNVRDPFNPFGNANMVEGGLILAHAAHMGGAEEIAAIFEMGTSRGLALLEGTYPVDASSHEITPGSPADLLVWDVDSPGAIIIDQARPRCVLVAGEIVVERRESLEVTDRLPSGR